MLKLHRSHPRLAALGMIGMFVGRRTVGAVASAIRYQLYIESQLKPKV